MNPIDMPSMKEVRYGVSEVDLPITMPDKICFEFLKALYRLFNTEWMSGTVPFDWEACVVVPIF